MILALVVLSWASVPARATELDSESIPLDEPAWISQAGNVGAESSVNYQRATFRSMGVLLLLIGSLLAVNHWLRRRYVAGQPLAGSSLKVCARLKLGVRQEVVVVEWGGDQMVLGVGPSFIQPLHIRRESAEDTEEIQVEGADHGQ